MRKRLLTLIGCALVMGTTLSGCGKTAGTAAGNEGGTEEAPKEAGENGAGVSDENGMKGADSVQNSGKGEAATDTTVTQKGPFGSISLTLPAGWKVELCPMDSDSLLMGDYGICFAPEDTDFGFVEVAYWQSFGVCGTGLEEEEVTVAGHPAWKGTYDGHEYWDFICWKEPVKGVVAMTGSVEEWWEGKEEAVMEILDTLAFDPDMREGGAYVYETESENERIGLYLSLEGISPSGAMLCYNQYDKEAPTGQLQDGDDFSIEVKKDGKWEEAPIVVEGDYGFHDIAYTIFTNDTTRRELSWEWLYGELTPGEYRIRKKVMDFRGTGDYDQYEIYAYFILN
ncbi:MAG: hypothetical protein HFH93_05660 [Lachnospiraceae bacterium]|nr:hypothetical protein [Lachnospiraceae bacterium]